MKQSVVVTGGSKGIGWEIVRTLASAGYHVVSGSRSLRESIPNEVKVNITQCQMNTINEKDHFRLAEIASEEGRQLIAYVNNAGFSEWRSIEEIDEKFLFDIISTNLIGYFWGAKAAAHHLKAGGSLINISSLAGQRGTSNNSAYVSTKFGVTGLTQSQSKELGARGIRVTSVCPVLVRSEGLLAALSQNSSPAKGNPTSFLEEFAKTQASLQRLPTAQEVADLVHFLISEKSQAITGQSINVDCGVLPN